MSKVHPQGTSKLGIAIKTGPKCKICQSPHRGEIEDILILRARGELTQTGERPTVKWIIDNAIDMWGMPLNEINIRGHFKNHVRVAGQTEVATTGKNVVTKKMEALLAAGDIEGVAPEVLLETVVAIAHAKILADPGSVTLDQGLKAVAELTKRRHDEQTANLMQGLVGAVQKSVLAGRPEPETIEAETVEELEPDGATFKNERSDVGGEQGVRSPEPVDLGERDADKLPGHQEPGIPGLRLSDPGQGWNAAPVLGDQGEASELEDVQ